jgi:formylglycine-generating enzyme required for sulfatase activity
MNRLICLGLCAFICLTQLLFAQERKTGERLVLKIKDTEFAFRWCPPGTFTMGSPKSEQAEAWKQVDAWAEARFKNDKDALREYKVSRQKNIESEKQHTVKLTKGFWIQETETTQAQWIAVNDGYAPLIIPEFFQNLTLPVVTVSFDNSNMFVGKLNKLNAAPTGFRFSLPSEAQWEYACRAGTTTAFSFGNSLNGDNANCDGNFPFGTATKGKRNIVATSAGTYKANAWGIFDMHGNVWEWCSDAAGDYPDGESVDPKGAESGTNHIYRGGSWQNRAGSCRSAYRGIFVVADKEFIRLGMRLCLVSEE